MNCTSRRTTAGNVAWLRPVRTDASVENQRTRLLLAINDAELMGFEATKSALISMLQELES